MSIKITFAGEQEQPRKEWTEEMVREHGAFAVPGGALRIFRSNGEGVFLAPRWAEGSSGSAAWMAEQLNEPDSEYRPVDVEIIVREVSS